MKSNIKIEYRAHLSHKAKKQSEMLLVEKDISKGYKTIKEHISRAYDINPPYQMLLNGRNILLSLESKQVKLNDSDTITLIGIISGG